VVDAGPGVKEWLDDFGFDDVANQVRPDVKPIPGSAPPPRATLTKARMVMAIVV